MSSLTARWQCVLVLSLSVAVVMPGRASAQNAGPSPASSPFLNLRSGDCQIRVELPQNASLGIARLLRNGNETTAEGRRRGKVRGNIQEVTFTVLEPPQFGDQFEVTAPGLASPVQAIVKAQGYNRSRCNIKDERDAFAPTVLIGLVADAFAPNEARFYPTPKDPEQDPYKLRNSMIARLDAQLRLGGNHGGVLDRFWVGLSMKYGVRSTDLDCVNADGTPGKDKDAPNCSGNAFVNPEDAGRTLTAAVLKASKIEAIIKPRYEFLTLFDNSDLPVALYLLGRFGFGQAPGEVKVESVFSAGAGFMFLAGAFRESSVETTYGFDRGYRTNPGGPRIRSDFRLLFGSPPGFLGQIPYVSKLVRAPRGLVEVIVDRNSFGKGPDGTQTFLGVVVDIKRLLP
jgi:hypothetical protein